MAKRYEVSDEARTQDMNTDHSKYFGLWLVLTHLHGNGVDHSTLRTAQDNFITWLAERTSAEAAGYSILAGNLGYNPAVISAGLSELYGARVGFDDIHRYAENPNDVAEKLREIGLGHVVEISGVLSSIAAPTTPRLTIDAVRKRMIKSLRGND